MPRALLIAVLVIGAVLAVTTVPAPFTVDENNYLVTLAALRAGRLTVPGTEDLPSTRELLYFDPSGYRREVRSTPVSSTAPPLYAVLGLPFSYLGWRGLVALNTLSFLATILMTFALTRRYAAAAETPWIAAAAVGAGAYFVEYAQGLWPHMITVALVTGATLLCARAIDESRVEWAAAAGFLAALAAGVRYQNAFIIGCLGLALLLLSRRRLVLPAALAAGAVLPLAVCSIMNFARLGSWNPISKGSGYGITAERMARGEGTIVGKIATMAWTRVVDYSAQPSLAGTVHESFLTPQPESGAFVLVTAVKKAWLQSAPWMIVPLILLVVAWLPASPFSRRIGPAPQRHLRLISLVVVATIGMFSAAGVRTTDGLCFNQRYFCELVPLMAVALAWGVEGIGLRARSTALLAGTLAGAALAFASLQPHHLAPLRHHLVRYLPLALALLFAAAWALWRGGRARGVEKPWQLEATAFALGATLAWGLTVHLGDDVPASRILRHSRQDYLRQLGPFISEHSAVFASGAIKDALGPLQLYRDVVIAVPGFDYGAATKELVETFLARGRRVFILPNALPRELLDPVLEGKQFRGLGQPVVLIEVSSGSGGAPADG